MRKARLLQEQGDVESAWSVYSFAVEKFLTQLKDAWRAAYEESIDQMLTLCTDSDASEKEKMSNSLSTNVRLATIDQDDPMVADVKTMFENACKVENKELLKEFIGIGNVKKLFYDSAVVPLHYINVLPDASLPWNGLLLYGAKSSGKSYMVKSLQNCVPEIPIVVIDPHEVQKQWKGREENFLTQMVQAALCQSPCVVVFDHLDLLVGSTLLGAEHEGIINKDRFIDFLKELERTSVFFIGITRQPWAIESVVTKRFSKKIYVPLPGDDMRAKIIERLLKDSIYGDLNSVVTVKEFDKIAKLCKGISFVDLQRIAHDVIIKPLQKMLEASHFKPVASTRTSSPASASKKLYVPCTSADSKAIPKTKLGHELTVFDLDMPPFSSSDFIKSLANVDPTLNKDETEKYKNWSQLFGAVEIDLNTAISE